jgi:hypothetical protein
MVAQVKIMNKKSDMETSAAIFLIKSVIATSNPQCKNISKTRFGTHLFTLCSFIDWINLPLQGDGPMVNHAMFVAGRDDLFKRNNLALINGHRAIHLSSKALVVGGDQRCQPGGPYQIRQSGKNQIGCGRIEITGRFVRQ